jgi:Spy/CpxP family protein refolding chaperone
VPAVHPAVAAAAKAVAAAAAAAAALAVGGGVVDALRGRWGRGGR